MRNVINDAKRLTRQRLIIQEEQQRYGTVGSMSLLPFGALLKIDQRNEQ